MPVKYVFVTGGVVSGLGKGITAASLGRLLKARGYKVTMQKFDPYINIDPGTMNPIQHGEVFVTDDGAETDLDLGHYERFIDESLTKNSNVTTGKVYWSVLQKERRGDFGGGTVQVIPHITNEIKSRFYRNFTSDETHIAIIEVGGTVGDIESQPFLEAIRQFQHEVGHENAILIHVTLIPYIKASGELKTKPTQASVKELQGMGIQPDIIVCRSEHELDQSLKDKIALFCNVPNGNVLQNLDVEYLYEAPLAMEKENLAKVACKALHLDCPEPDLKDWEAMVDSLRHPNKEVKIALVGKYIALHDAYISVVEALKHGGIAEHATVNIKWVDSEELTPENIDEYLGDVSGILVPGGFGSRGVEGKILAAQYAREHKVPYLGLCLGMQVAIIEFAIAVNMAVPYYQGVSLPFVASIVIGTIQLGATVDYAIVYTNRYLKERRNGKNKLEAISIAHKSNMLSIITSALSLFAATYGVACYSQVDMIGSICTLLARGAIISMIVVLTLLPTMFLIFDKAICKTTKGMGHIDDHKDTVVNDIVL